MHAPGPHLKKPVRKQKSIKGLHHKCRCGWLLCFMAFLQGQQPDTVWCLHGLLANLVSLAGDRLGMCSFSTKAWYMLVGCLLSVEPWLSLPPTSELRKCWLQIMRVGVHVCVMGLQVC